MHPAASVGCFLENMRENLDRCGSSSLTVVEKKRPHRPGGCSGVFFQLFDWNRKLAKRLLFSKKVLPSGHPKQQMRRRQKLQAAKLLQTADEKSKASMDVFRTGDELQMCRMQVPSLLPRLMGLESIPIVKRGKLNKESGGNGCNEFGGTEKVDNKRGDSERRAIARLGSEAIHLKSTLSRKHHIKLPALPPHLPPRKATSKWHHGRGASKLIGAATRILEPGLQSKTPTRHSLMCSNHLNQHTSVESKTVIPSGGQGPSLALSVSDGGHISGFSRFQENMIDDGGLRFTPIPVADEWHTSRFIPSAATFVAQDRPIYARITSPSSESRVSVSASRHQPTASSLHGVTHFPAKYCHVGDSVQPGIKAEGMFCCRPNVTPALVGNPPQRTIIRNYGTLNSKKGTGENGRQCKPLNSKEGRVFHSRGTSGELKEDKVFTTESEWKMGDSMLNEVGGTDNSRELREDTLSMFLQRKLRELNREEEGLMEGRIPKRSVTMILQEIINVLSREQHFLQEHELSHRYSTLSAGAPSSSEIDATTLCEEAVSVRESVAECMQLSPGSVLESCFSNDTIFTNSLGEVGDSRRGEAQQWAENGGEGGSIVDSVSTMMLGDGGGRPVDDKVWTILNSQLLLKDRGDDGLVFSSLLHSLEKKMGTSLPGGFLLDSLFEFIDAHCVEGFGEWMSRGVVPDDMLVLEIYEEMKRWKSFEGMAVHRILDREMGEVQWTWSPTYHTAVDVSNHIFNTLLGEMFTDLF